MAVAAFEVDFEVNFEVDFEVSLVVAFAADLKANPSAAGGVDCVVRVASVRAFSGSGCPLSACCSHLPSDPSVPSFLCLGPAVAAFTGVAAITRFAASTIG